MLRAFFTQRTRLSATQSDFQRMEVARVKMLRKKEKLWAEEIAFGPSVVTLCFLPPRQILLSLLAQELHRALAEFGIVRQPIERIPPQKIRADGVLLEAG